MYNIYNYCTTDICIDKQLSHIFDFLHNKKIPKKLCSHKYYHLLSNWYNNNNNMYLNSTCSIQTVQYTTYKNIHKTVKVSNN